MGGAFSWMGAWWPFGGLGEAKLLVRSAARPDACAISASSLAHLLPSQITGLDAAGKTTMLYRMKLGAIVTTIPTIGFNVETIQVGDLTITSWDMGGRVRKPLRYFAHYEAYSFIFHVARARPLRTLYRPGDLDHLLVSFSLAFAPFHPVLTALYHHRTRCAHCGDSTFRTSRR